MAQDREKKLEKLKANKIKLLHSKKKVKINMDMNRTSSNYTIKNKKKFVLDMINQLTIILLCLTLDVYKGEKILIVGENGVGKSTLLKLIIGQLIPDSGEIYLGNKTDIGYYAQEHELLDNNKRFFREFSSNNIPKEALKALLGRFYFLIMMCLKSLYNYHLESEVG